MLYYVNLSDQHSGDWLGVMIINTPTEEAARDLAVLMLAAQTGFTNVVAISIAEIPPGAPPVPAEAYGQLFTTTADADKAFGGKGQLFTFEDLKLTADALDLTN